MAVRLTVLFRGRVQGVGFRYTACRLAEAFDVTGQVANLPDGSVEMIVEGDRQAAAELVKAVRGQMAGYIRDVSSHESTPTGEFGDFRIAY